MTDTGAGGLFVALAVIFFVAFGVVPRFIRRDADPDAADPARADLPTATLRSDRSATKRS